MAAVARGIGSICMRGQAAPWACDKFLTTPVEASLTDAAARPLFQHLQSRRKRPLQPLHVTVRVDVLGGSVGGLYWVLQES